MNWEKDYSKAAEYFERANRLGNPDAMYNLGIMHLYGTYPGREKDAVREPDTHVFFIFYTNWML